MKYLRRYDALCKRLLILRYGSEFPSKTSFPLFSLTVVAKYMKIQINEAIAFENKYFREIYSYK